MSINKFLIIKKDNTIEIAVQSEIDEQACVSVLEAMFEDKKILKINSDEEKNIFENSVIIDELIYDPKPYESWIPMNGKWVAPKEYPNDGKLYIWDETSADWKQYQGTTIPV